MTIKISNLTSLVFYSRKISKKSQLSRESQIFRYGNLVDKQSWLSISDSFVNINNYIYFLNHFRPYVIFIDGFASNFMKNARDITEIISVSESVHPQPYIICTITQSPNNEIPTSWQNSFKLVSYFFLFLTRGKEQGRI